VLNELKNKTTKAAKRMKESERRCMVDDDIRSRYQERQGLLMTIIVLALRRKLRLTLGVFFRYADLKKKRVGYPSANQDQGHRKFVICLRGL
jgi:hypothetical protein